MIADLYPGAKWHPSELIGAHPLRPATLGIVIHWTVGREAGDLTVLDGPNVDCQFYVAKDGDTYQLLDPDQVGWHAKTTANTYCIGIEHESSGEPYTPAQLEASSRLVAWLCKRYAIPVVHTDPSGHDLSTFRGIFGHRDLSLGGLRVDANDHTDTIPAGTRWERYLAAVRAAMGQETAEVVDLSALPGDATLRLHVGGRIFTGWENAAGPLRWLARNGCKDAAAAIAWQRSVWRGPEKVTGVARHLAAKYLAA